MNNDKNDTTVKRGRGRPPKNKVAPDVVKNGIVSTPTLKDAVMELQYHIPIVFKKIFSLFEQIKIHNLKIEFKSRYILIKTIDSVEKNTILLTINCEEMVSYYCKFDFEINIDSNILQKLLKKIDSLYTDICFYSTEENYNNEINIILYQSDVKMKEKHIIKLTDNDSIEDTIKNIKLTNEYKTYPIQLKFKSKFFKKLINDINSISDEFIIEKKFNSPLTFKYKNVQNKLISKNMFKSSNDISLVSTQEQGDIFGATTYTTQIKPISSNILSDTIKIYLKQDKDIVFQINIEKNTFMFLIHTKIKTPLVQEI